MDMIVSSDDVIKGSNEDHKVSLWKLKVRNFKRLKEAEISLGQFCVFIGPSAFGKSTALQALKLWHTVILKLSEPRNWTEAQVRRRQHKGGADPNLAGRK